MFKNISIERNRKDLSALSGLYFFDDLIKRCNLMGDLGKILPRKKRKHGLLPKEQFYSGVMGFIAGAECLEDLDDLREDPLFSSLTNGAVASTTMGKFMRSFRQKDYELLQDLHLKSALSLRERLYPGKEVITLTMDSTHHEQYGLKMEGVEWDYANRRCLNSQNVFDEYGLSYGWELRSGGTYSGNGAVEMLERIFKEVPGYWRKFFRADSAYSNLEIYNTLLVKNVNFAISLKENVWGALLDKYGTKISWKKTRMRFFESNKCEIGSCLYPVRGLWGRSFLRVVFIRAQKKDPSKEDKQTEHYYAVVSNMDSYEMSDERVLDFYRKRSNVENYIKDLKHGMDFKHFPCQKLMANRIWGMMGLCAYNLMRFASHVLYPGRGCFLKRVRTKMVYLAAQIVNHARTLRIRFADFYYQEVNQIKQSIHERFCSLGVFRLQVRGQSPPL